MKLQISDGYKSFGAFDILEGAGLQVKASEKIGLVDAMERERRLC